MTFPAVTRKFILQWLTSYNFLLWGNFKVADHCKPSSCLYPIQGLSKFQQHLLTLNQAKGILQFCKFRIWRKAALHSSRSVSHFFLSVIKKCYMHLCTRYCMWLNAMCQLKAFIWKRKKHVNWLGIQALTNHNKCSTGYARTIWDVELYLYMWCNCNLQVHFHFVNIHLITTNQFHITVMPSWKHSKNKQACLFNT